MSTRSLANIKFSLKLTAANQNTLVDGNVVSVNQPNFTFSPTWANGIEADQANRSWQSADITLLSGANSVYSLFNMLGWDIGGGQGNDALGQAVNFEEIVAIVIQNNNAVGEAGLLEINPFSSGGWTPIGIHTVATGGALGGQGVLAKIQPAADGFDVVEITSHQIEFTANGGDVNFSWYILARNDDEESSSSTSSSSSSSSSSISTSSNSSSQSSSSWSSLNSSDSSSISSSSISTSSISTSSESSSSWST